ncbi:MAG: hypothetical protein K2H53_05975 [Clostridia bacterium]|nr:hypothetical protein [Clostridia bacterium]
MSYFVMIMCAIILFLLNLILYRYYTYDRLKAEWKAEHERETQKLKETIEEYERRENMRELMKQCENEDIAKRLLLATKDKSEKAQESKRDLLDGILSKRKNLYVNA